MVATVQETKSKLNALLTRVEKGEDIVITVRGKPRARLTRIPRISKPDMASWARELKALHRRHRSRNGRHSAQEIISELREERA